MTSRERVQRAIQFRKPDRIPVYFPDLGVSDLVFVADASLPFSGRWEGSFWRDEWGCGWERVEGGPLEDWGQVVDFPLACWENLSHYQWPEPRVRERWELLSRLRAAADRFPQEAEAYHLVKIPFTLFERLWALRGMENLLLDFLDYPERVQDLADRVLEFQKALIRGLEPFAPHFVQGVFFTDDWGSQTGPLISPKVFDTFLLPRYRQLIQLSHELRLDVWFHTCGNTLAYIERMLEVGVDVLHLEQPRLLGLEEVSERLAGRVCLAAMVDLQRTLPRSSPVEVEEEAYLLATLWGTPEGGFIGMDYEEAGALGIPRENREAALKGFLRGSRRVKG